MKQVIRKALGKNERLWVAIKKPKYLLKGVATYLPTSLHNYLPRHQPQFTGRGVRKGKINAREAARASYTVWLRFLVRLHDDPEFDFARVVSVGEIGPGDNLGIGFAALLSGASSFHALDVVPTAYSEDNDAILEELIKLFQERASIPDDNEFPKAHPRLSSYAFPSKILTEKRLKNALTAERVEGIRRALAQFKRNGKAEGEISLHYTAPWTMGGLQEDSLDLLVSNAALEHVDDLEETYVASARLVRPGGWCAHAIGLNSHDTASLWNGHWIYSDLAWKVIRGRSAYLINRAPCSVHCALLQKEGFRIALCDRYKKPNNLRREDLARRFANIPDEDLETQSVFIAAQERAVAQARADQAKAWLEASPRSTAATGRSRS